MDIIVSYLSLDFDLKKLSKKFINNSYLNNLFQKILWTEDS